MAQLPIRNLRLRAFTSAELDRTSGSSGDIYYDSTNRTLRVYLGAGDSESLARSDLVNVSNADFLTKANSAGFSGGVQAGVAGRLAYYPATGSQVNDLEQIYWHTHDGASMLHITGELEVSGQKNRIRFHWDTLADLTSQVPAVDWHGMVAHAHDTGKLYYAHAGAWVAVASESALPASFSTIAVAGQQSVVADSTSDTLTLAAGTNITITNNAGTDTITINSTTSTGTITFVGNTIDSTDSTAITITPLVSFESDVVVGNEIVFADGTRQSTSAVGIPGPQGVQGPPGASGSGSGDVVSAGGSYVDNRIVRYDGTTGTIIQVSSASISDAGLLTATSFSGAGSLITALNATELTSGTIPDARFPATLPAASGVNLTALNATQLTSGTVPDARFPATLPAASGVNLTALNATNLGSGTVPVLRLGASGTRDATTYLRGDNTWATVSGGSASDSFSTIAVAGQSSVVADSATDTLTLVAGSNITITTNASTDTVTIASASGATTLDGLSDVIITSASNGQVLKYNGSNWINDTDATAGAGSSDSFATIAVAGQSSVVADSSTDTLTLAAGTGISITTNNSTDTVTITSTVSAGATAFTGLSDRSNLTVDQFYLPAITRLAVTASGSSAYLFDQYTGNNPTIYAISGTTIAFDLSNGLGSHPFVIRYSGADYNTGLTHVTTAGVVTTGASAQDKTSGTLYWKIPYGISGTYGYLCRNHGGMNGSITVKDISAI